MIPEEYVVERGNGTVIGWDAFLKERRGHACLDGEAQEVQIRLRPAQNNRMHCPRCGTAMVSNGNVRRTVVDAGVTYVFTIKQYLCPRCRDEHQQNGSVQYVHRALPENMLPYKRTTTEVIAAYGILEQKRCRKSTNETEVRRARDDFDATRCEADERTLSRWGIWYQRLKRSLAVQLKRAQRPGPFALAGAIEQGAETTGQIALAVRTILRREGRISIEPVFAVQRQCGTMLSGHNRDGDSVQTNCCEGGKG